ncbi:hypothetical protein SBBP2_500002 [Burkholderiales bacterium]|nr:hypothetical protein SBBP2_500002 [Burkholderiales bacterium]
MRGHLQVLLGRSGKANVAEKRPESIRASSLAWRERLASLALLLILYKLDRSGAGDIGDDHPDHENSNWDQDFDGHCRDPLR